MSAFDHIHDAAIDSGTLSLSQPVVGETSFDQLAETIFELVPRKGHEERAALVRDRAALLVDSLLVRVVRGQGAVDLAIGRDLHALSKGKSLNRLGYVRLGDYARERLGIPEGTAREMVRLAKGLECLPALHAAVWSGEVEASKALAVLPVVTPETETTWLEAARKKTVRELRREAREARGDAPCAEEALGPFERVSVMMKRKDHAVLGEALDVARELEGATAPRWMLIEALAAEFIGSFASVIAAADKEEFGEGAGVGVGRTVLDGSAVVRANGQVLDETEVPASDMTGRHAQMSGNDRQTQMSGDASNTQMSGDASNTQMSGDASNTQMSGGSSAIRPIHPRRTNLRMQHLPPAWVEECCEYLKEWTDGWSFLEQDIPRVPGLELEPVSCPFTLDARLQKLARMRDGWGELTGRLALIIKVYGLWRDMQFVAFSHYCNERLSSSARAIEQRAFLERRLFELPGLREALQRQEINYSKALVLAYTSNEASIEERIEWAKEYTCKEMRNALDNEREAEEQEALKNPVQAETYVDVDLDGPAHTTDLLSDALFAAKAIWKAGGLGWMAHGDALAFVAEHFIDVWKGRTGAVRGKRSEILGRHRGQCCVPTCTLPAEEQHHVVFRSRGGGDEKENQVGICVTHHDDLHDGYLRVTGQASERLVYELGLRSGAPTETFMRH